MSRSCADAFWGRAYEEPLMGPMSLKELGVRDHRARVDMLDTVIRKYLASPDVEVFPDETIRWHIKPARIVLWDEVGRHAVLRRYTQLSLDWATLLSPICVNCCEPHTAHLNDKCLFAASTWREYIPDKPSAVWG